MSKYQGSDLKQDGKICHLLPTTYETNGRRTPKAKHCVEKRKTFARNKEKCARLLCDIHALIWQQMFDNLLTRSSRNVSLSKDTENSMAGASKQ